eukprot:1752505-Amphidinium_carterae.3
MLDVLLRYSQAPPPRYPARTYGESAIPNAALMATKVRTSSCDPPATRHCRGGSLPNTCWICTSNRTSSMMTDCNFANRLLVFDCVTQTTPECCSPLKSHGSTKSCRRMFANSPGRNMQ